MQSDEIYRFEIHYVNEKGEKERKAIYSDNSDIYSLSDIPDGTFYIQIDHFKNLSNIHIGTYLLGTPLPVEELKKEIELTNNLEDRYEFKAVLGRIERGVTYSIFRKQGKLMCFYRFDYSGEIIAEVENGRIVNKSDAKIVDEDNYIGLE